MVTLMMSAGSMLLTSPTRRSLGLITWGRRHFLALSRIQRADILFIRTRDYVVSHVIDITTCQGMLEVDISTCEIMTREKFGPQRGNLSGNGPSNTNAGMDWVTLSLVRYIKTLKRISLILSHWARHWKSGN